MNITRRNILKALLVGAAAVVTPPIVAPATARAEQALEYRLECDVVLKEGIFKENQERIFNLAKQYFKEEVGIEVDFDFYEREQDLPENDRVRVVELKPKEVNERVYAPAKKRIEAKMAKVDEARKNVRRMIGDERYVRHGQRLLNQFQRLTNIHAQLYKQKLGIRHDMHAAAWTLAGIQTGENVYLVDGMLAKMGRTGITVRDPNYDAFGDLRKVLAATKIDGDLDYKVPVFKPGIRVKNEQELAADLDMVVKRKTRTVVHELCHYMGLGHTFDVGLEDTVRYGVPNAMAYKEVGRGKYGFDLEVRQKQKIRKYLGR
ncbi:hypothetical protein CMO91_03000 [Candidatus Woesearchaeota archaeon]|nr:hypothetical protein [Candidatus Woesearchaeota archaeon]